MQERSSTTLQTNDSADLLSCHQMFQIRLFELSYRVKTADLRGRNLLTSVCLTCRFGYSDLRVRLEQSPCHRELPLSTAVSLLSCHPTSLSTQTPDLGELARFTSLNNVPMTSPTQQALHQSHSHSHPLLEPPFHIPITLS